MSEISEQIRAYVETVAPPIPIEEALGTGRLHEPHGLGRPAGHGRVLAVVCVVVLVVGTLAALVVLRSGHGPTRVDTVGDSGVGYDEMTREERRAEVEDHWAAVQGGEWTPYHGRSGVEAIVVPEGWVRVDASADGLHDAATSGIPVFDEPDGEILGYDFPDPVGFVPRGFAEAPGFDPQVFYETAPPADGGSIEVAPGWTAIGIDPATKGLGPGKLRPRGVVRTEDFWGGVQPIRVYDRPDGTLIYYAVDDVYIEPEIFETPGFDVDTYVAEHRDPDLAAEDARKDGAVPD